MAVFINSRKQMATVSVNYLGVDDSVVSPLYV